MKIYVVLWVAVGISFSLANLVPSQTPEENLILIESDSSRTSDDDKILLINTKLTQKDDEISTNNEPNEEDVPKFEEAVDVVVEENISNPDESVDLRYPVTDVPLELPVPQVVNFDEELVPMRDEDFYYNDLINRDPNEIMDTAAGFVPVPIFRKKKKTQRPRQPFASRRYFRKPYPYRRMYYFYPYYGYYPSSLRFY